MLRCPCYWPESRIKIRVAVNAFATTGPRYLLFVSMVLEGERCGRLASHGLSANLMIARQENVQGSRSHFPILVKLFALWWQMLAQTSDITVRSQIAKACAHCWRPDCDCLFRSYAVDIYALRSFSCLFNLLLADTDTAPFNFSRTTAADPGLMLQTPSPLLLTNKRSFSQTNVCDRFKRSFTECSARFGSACYLLRQPLLLTC